MKNVFVIFLMGFSLTIMAQHVTPLDIKIAELNLDSLRGAYLAQPTMYRASLDVVAEHLEENAQQIKEAQNELRIEMIHAKEMRRVLNEGVKRLSVLKKTYAKEEAEIKSLMETLENQRQKLEKQKPRSLAAAGRIPGVSPADVAVLMVWLERSRHQQSEC